MGAPDCGDITYGVVSHFQIKNDDSAGFRPYARDTNWFSEIIVSIKTLIDQFVQIHNLNLKPQSTQK